MNVLLVGNSFIRRLRQKLIPAQGSLDVRPQDTHVASSLADKLDISDKYSQVFTFFGTCQFRI